MKPILSLTLLTALVAATSSCVVRIGDRDSDGTSYVRKVVKSKSPSKVAYDNRKNLACLAAGMTVAEVLDVMEEGTWGQSSTALSNPHSRESFPTASGGQADILFFYTETRKEDGLVGEDELTPVYFENGTLAGWGPFAFDAWRERVLGL